jgi:DNA-binding response OmpR family regulator
LPSKHKSSDGRPRILVVDDDSSLIKLVIGLLADSFEVLSAATAEEGLRRANIERPDLILLDLWLPDLDGIEVAERLRRSAATSLIPVIMLTGDDSSEVASLRAGVDDYVVKPFDEDALVARIESVLRRSSPIRAHALSTS